MLDTEAIIKKVTDHVEKTLAEDIKNKIRDSLKELVKAEFNELHIRLDTLEKNTHTRFNTLENTVDHWKSDLDDDRDNLKGIRLNTASTSAQADEISKTVEGLPKKIDTAIKDAVAANVASEVPKAVNDTFVLFGKKVKAIEKPRGWLRKLKFWK